MKAISSLMIASAIAACAFADIAEGAETRRKFPPKVKVHRQHATPRSGRCEGIGYVKTEGGKCLRWVYR